MEGVSLQNGGDSKYQKHQPATRGNLISRLGSKRRRETALEAGKGWQQAFFLKGTVL